MEKIDWTDRVRKKVIGRFIEERIIVHATNIRNRNCIGHILRRKCLIKQVIERKVERKLEVKKGERRRCKQLLNDLKEKREYWKLKRKH
jgi:hypothetical protein